MLFSQKSSYTQLTYVGFKNLLLHRYNGYNFLERKIDVHKKKIFVHYDQRNNVFIREKSI